MKNKFSTILSLAVLLLALVSCGGKNKEIKINEESIRVRTLRVSPKEAREVLSYSGAITADNKVTLNFMVSGQVAAVQVEEGQHVYAGQLLANIDATEYRNGLMLAEASLEQAKDNFTRLEKLHSAGSLPEREYIAVKVSLTQAEINKNTASKRLNDSKLYAPFSGIISSKQIDKGSTVGPGVTAFSIVKTDQVYAQASISEDDISKISVGDKVEVKIPALNQFVKGQVTIINPQADDASRTFLVKVRLKNSDGKILPGMISTIDVETNQTVRALSIPVKAIVRDADDIVYVFAIDSSSHAKRIRVRVGKLLAEEVSITDGLRENENVVVEGQNSLRDGQLVSQIIP